MLQGQVAAVNVAAEITGRAPQAEYNHELMLVIDAGEDDSIYRKKELWEQSPERVHQGRFWGWAKRLHARYWQQMRLNHSEDEKLI